MSTQPIAASRYWFAISPDGEEIDVEISVGVPTPTEHGEWCSVASLGRLELKTYSILGIDSWQAIHLAMKFVSTRLMHFAESGWRFYWKRGGEDATPEVLAGTS